MSAADAAVLAARRGDLASAAEFHGYDVTNGAWILSQVACPYAPNYLILHDVQLHQEGSVSLFTALVPRGPGPVRIFPVLHHGAQALHIFGTSPQQRRLIEEVISVRPEGEVPTQDGDWTTLAYCYGALAGAEPTVGGLTAPDEMVPRLMLGGGGKLRGMSFSIMGPDHFFQDWTIQFDGHGGVRSIALSARAAREPRVIRSPGLPPSHPIRPSATQGARVSPGPQ